MAGATGAVRALADRHERHNRWSADGTWARLLAAAQADADAAGQLDWLVAADSSLVRVHQHGATARRTGGNAATAAGPAGGTGGWVAEPGEHAIGRSRGGLTTKIHLLVDGRGRPLVLLLTAGNINDATMFAQLIGSLRVPERSGATADYVVADRGGACRDGTETTRSERRAKDRRQNTLMDPCAPCPQRRGGTP